MRDIQSKLNKLKDNMYFGIGMLILFSVIFAFIGLFFSAKPFPMSFALLKSYITNPAILIVNYIPYLVIALLGFFISNRIWIGTLIGGILPTIFLFINCFKVKFRNDVLTLVDVTLATEAANMGTRYSFMPDIYMIFAIIFILASIVFCFFLCKYKFKKPVINVCWVIAVIISMVLCFEFVYVNEKVYDKLSNIEKNSAFLNDANKNDQYICRGFIYSFIHSATDLIKKPPENYNKKQTKELLESQKYDSIPEGKKINMICVMLEAYNDFSKFENVKFKNNPYSLYHKVRDKSVHGQLFTNIFGGGTIDTERNFITGFSNMYDYNYPLKSYARYFKEQGYTVEGGHPGHDWFYDRYLVNSYFGFENYYFLENRYQKLYDSTQHKINDGILEDKYLFEDIISLYEQNKQTGKPYFNFSVTYQNHGPYETEKLLTDKIYVEKTDEMSDETFNIANNYFAGIEQTNEAIYDLVQWADSQHEPIMLVLFGDHNPWMGDGLKGYYEMGINVNTATPIGFYNYYLTPYIIYSNPKAREVTQNDCLGDGGDFSPMYLMNKVFEINNWGGNNFMKLTNQLKKHIDIVTYTGVVRETGEFVSNPSDKAKKAFENVKNAEYYITHNKTKKD